jgi:adenylosuccinate lyase
MIEKYTRPAMGAIWSEERKIALWLKVEIAVCEAWAEEGVVPAEALPAIRAATVDLDRMREIERETEHDVIAFLRAAGETVGPDARWIHLGLTSSDVIDTALSCKSSKRSISCWPTSTRRARRSARWRCGTKTRHRSDARTAFTPSR